MCCRVPQRAQNLHATAAAMIAGSRQRWAALLSLASGPQPDALVAELHARLLAAAAACRVSPADAMDQQTAGRLLGIEAVNSFGVMGVTGAGGERSLRGSGIYAQAAMLNHECLPNVARSAAEHPLPGSSLAAE